MIVSQRMCACVIDAGHLELGRASWDQATADGEVDLRCGGCPNLKGCCCTGAGTCFLGILPAVPCGGSVDVVALAFVAAGVFVVIAGLLKLGPPSSVDRSTGGSAEPSVSSLSLVNSVGGGSSVVVVLEISFSGCVDFCVESAASISVG